MALHKRISYNIISAVLKVEDHLKVVLYKILGGLV